jgi:hypothetical protein
VHWYASNVTKDLRAPDPNKADRYGVPWFYDDNRSAADQAAREDWIHETWLALDGPSVEDLLQMVAAKEPVKRTDPLSIAQVLDREKISRATFDRWWLPRLLELDPPGAYKIGGAWKVLPRALDELREERKTVRPGRPPTRTARRPLRPTKPSGDRLEL